MHAKRQTSDGCVPSKQSRFEVQTARLVMERDTEMAKSRYVLALARLVHIYMALAALEHIAD